MKSLIELAKQYYKKYREVIIYLITGGITTVINFVIFYICTNLFDIFYVISNIIAWFAAVISAFIMNKLFVFQDNDLSGTTIVRQLITFTGFRVLSGVAETGLLCLFVEMLHMNENVVKLIVAVLVVIMNYIFSKIFIFKKKKSAEK